VQSCYRSHTGNARATSGGRGRHPGEVMVAHLAVVSHQPVSGPSSSADHSDPCTSITVGRNPGGFPPDCILAFPDELWD